MTDLDNVVERISQMRNTMPAEHTMLAGISGIDASGKGYIASQVKRTLDERGLRTALINVDGWLNLPHVRFNSEDPALHFYLNALRLNEMFEWLILPLRQNRSVHLVADHVEETATEYLEHTYDFDNIDIILLEGIFLFKPQYAGHFDLRIWVECSFDTALERAIGRAQEALGRDETIRAYESIYFPAQRMHYALDHPRSAAHLIISND